MLTQPALMTFFLTGVAAPVQEAIDPYELIEAVEILSKLPKDFYENLVSAENTETHSETSWRHTILGVHLQDGDRLRACLY